ncbi:hypothetical protein BDW71DRAFT_170740 [Aspergillus fruticulosus]
MTAATKYSSKLANQRILIFGGTSGIGFYVAEAAIENGAHLILSARIPPTSGKQSADYAGCGFACLVHLVGSLTSGFSGGYARS